MVSLGFVAVGQVTGAIPAVLVATPLRELPTA